MKFNKIGLFAGGVLFGTAGLAALCSKDAKKIYAHTTAGVLRAKEKVMKSATEIREEAGDIIAEAKDINKKQSTNTTENTLIVDEAKTK